MQGLSKDFVGVRVLFNVDLKVAPGEVRAFLGGNGSGKSTLIKIISGYHRPEPGGTVEIGGRPLRLGSKQSSYRLGCRVIQQDGDLISDLTVFDNLCLTSGYPSRWGTVRRRYAEALAAQEIERLDLKFKPSDRVGDLTMAERTGVALVRALQRDERYPAKFLILDEPTATMPSQDVDHLAKIVRRVAAQGVGVLYVSHRLQEIFAVADQVTVIRDGRIVVTSDVRHQTERSLAELISGHEIRKVSVRNAAPASEANALLTVRKLVAGPIREVSLQVAAGEIVGVVGITGSGREALLASIFGAAVRTAGHVNIEGRTLPQSRTDLSVARGMAFLPADRKVHGGVMDLSARENLTLANLGPFWRRGWLSLRTERAEARVWLERLDVHPRDGLERPLATFSGGNQQKLMFAKWLRCRPKIFLLDEPTQGVDVSAKEEIHQLILDIAKSGSAVLICSSDLEEITAVCHRVLVLHEGQIVCEVNHSQVSMDILTNLVLGVDDSMAAAQ